LKLTSTVETGRFPRHTRLGAWGAWRARSDRSASWPAPVHRPCRRLEW